MAELKPCVTCGKLFEACNHCENIKTEYQANYGILPWRTVACSVECYQIYEILRQYTFNYIDIAQAKEMLSQFELPNFVVPEVKATVEKIMAYKVAELEPVAKDFKAAKRARKTTKSE